MTLAHNLGMDVVAEGVETSDQVGTSSSILGCEYGQGFFFSRPVDGPVAEALLAGEMHPGEAREAIRASTRRRPRPGRSPPELPDPSPIQPGAEKCRNYRKNRFTRRGVCFIRRTGRSGRGGDPDRGERHLDGVKCRTRNDRSAPRRRESKHLGEPAIPQGRRTRDAPAIAAMHILWITAGLGCDGDSIAMTAATQPSLEDLVLGAIPGLPEVRLHHPVLAYENGDEFLESWYRAAEGRLDPFLLVVEGSIPERAGR